MNRLVRPVMFAFEPDVVFVFGRVSFGAAGAPTLDTKNSKGLCNVALNTIAFTGTTTASTSVTAVSSFAGLYVGMTITGTNIPANTTISSMNAGGNSLVLSQAATGANTGLTASGGQYVLTLGSQFTPFKRLDTYVKLLNADVTFDESASQGGAGVLALAPAGGDFFVVNNSVSNANLASVTIQFGTFVSATSFIASNPQNGESCEIALCLCRSTAI